MITPQEIVNGNILVKCSICGLTLSSQSVAFLKKARKICGKICKKCKAKRKKQQLLDSPLLKQKAQERNLKDYYLNKEARQAKHKEWLSKDNNNERALAKAREYKQKNRERIREQRRNKRRSCPVTKMASSCRSIVRTAFKNKGLKKDTKTEALLGCSFENLKNHIESLFSEGMTWDNYGCENGKWVVDHIKPICSFNLMNENDKFACFNYKNLRPLWHVDNMSKIKEDKKNSFLRENGICYCFFTSTKGHFGQKDIYKTTVSSFPDAIFDSIFKEKVVHIKREEGDDELFSDMRDYFLLKGFKVLFSFGKWSHNTASHAEEYTKDIIKMFNDKTVHTCRYSFFEEDDYLLSAKNIEELTKHFYIGSDILLHNPELLRVRFKNQAYD